MRQLHLIVLAAAAVALAAGCASEPKPGPNLASAMMTASDATPRATAAPAPQARQDKASASSGSVHIDDKIRKACGDLPVAHFAFDSARVEGEAAAALDALARCFATGPLRGRSMRLIGHTDARGEVEYNLALGQRRAGSVADYVSSHGVEKAHVGATSHGEFDATGTDEEGWARDRKVDVLLAE
jgi:peptidoglycan-associated lipoprotein